MTIAAVLGAIFAGLVFILLRMQQAANATRDIADAANDVSGMFRSWKWRRKMALNPLDAITDPREAAAVMMTSVAEADGNLTEIEKEVILSEMGKSFGATRKQGEEMLAQARFLIRDTRNPADILRRLAPVIAKSLGTDEQAQLLAMLTAVASANGPAGDGVTGDIKMLGNLLKASR